MHKLIVVPLLFGLSLWSFTMTGYNLWLAGWWAHQLPADSRGLYEQRFWIYLLLTFVTFVGAIGLVVSAWIKSRRESKGDVVAW